MGFDCLTSIFSHLKWVSYIYFYVLKRIYSRIYCEYVYKIVKAHVKEYLALLKACVLLFKLTPPRL